jgi:cobalt-zinc-cadmium efflux system outer membrane protein
LVAIAEPALAQEKLECSARITRDNLVSCALAASLTVRREHATSLALEGRRAAFSPLLPSNPVLALTGARRASVGTEPTAINWSATLSQELELAGQRASRLREADAELDAQAKRILLSKRDTAIVAWDAFFSIIAAQQELGLSERLLLASQRVRDAVRAKAQQGLAATVDADVADAANLRVLQSQLAAERTLSTARARIAWLLGSQASSAALTIEGELIPLALPSLANGTRHRDLSARPEILILEAERGAMLARAEAFRRSRIPNPTVSLFAQNDGYNERVVGVGVSFPIPLPTPVGRVYAGEIAEAEALARRAETDRVHAEREIRLTIATAVANLEAHRKAVEAFRPEVLKRAEDSLRDLAEQIQAGRLSVRESLVAQQALIDMLQNHIAERRALCLASVELAAALGLSLEAGIR